MARAKEPFLYRRLRTLAGSVKDINKFTETEKGLYNPMKSWAAMKLIVLDYFASAYTAIISKRYKNYYYIDLFSGSGIGMIKDSKNDLILGSPILIGAYRNFTHVFFCDNKTDRAKALEKRISLVRAKEYFSVYKNDCNPALDEIIPQISNGHSLIFIDPYGMEMDWSSTCKVLALENADIIINFQTKGNARGISQKDKITSAAKRFFGDGASLEEVYNNGSISEFALGETLLNLYVKRIKEMRAQIDGVEDDTIIEIVRIKKDETFYYDLLFIFRKTGGKNPWLKVIFEVRDAVKNLKAEDIRSALDVLAGRTRLLYQSEDQPKPVEKQKKLSDSIAFS